MARKLHDWLDTYLQFTDNSEPPRSYHNWVGVSTIAACLQRKCYHDLGMMRTYPNFYVVLVGPPGLCRKGTAMGIGESMLRELGVRLSANATSKQALIRKLIASMEAVTGTPEVLVMHSSLTCYIPELTTFLGYKNLDFIGVLCDWFDCGDVWENDTIIRGGEQINNLWVNILGATTPDLIRSAMPMDLVGGGLSSRIIFVYEDHRRFAPIPYLTEVQAAMYPKLIHDLEVIRGMSGQFKHTEEWQDAYIDWRTKEEKTPSFRATGFEYYVERRPKQVLKLSMIMCASRTDSMVIELQDLERALNLLRRTEIKMPRVFAGFGISEDSEVMARIMDTIGQRRELTYEELLAARYQDVRSEKQLEELIEVLRKVGFCEVLSLGSGVRKIRLKKGTQASKPYEGLNGQAPQTAVAVNGGSSK